MGRIAARGVASRLVGAAVALGAALNACTSPTGLPLTARKLTPPAIYSRWWTMMESCSGKSADYRGLAWYLVPGASLDLNGTDVVGYYSPAGRRVVVTDESRDDGFVIRHEMLHALLNTPRHPRDQFLGACRDLVNCERICVAEGGLWTPPSPFVALTVDSLLIRTDVTLEPREKDGQRWVSVLISAKNPLNRAVVALPIGARFTWGITVGGAFSTSSAVQDSSSLFFGANEARHWLYEMRVSDAVALHTLRPGQYYLSGGFGQHWTLFTEIVVED